MGLREVLALGVGVIQWLRDLRLAWGVRALATATSVEGASRTTQTHATVGSCERDACLAGSSDGHGGSEFCLLTLSAEAVMVVCA